MAEVPPEGYVLAEEQGEMYFCNARCRCLWALHFVTNPRRSKETEKDCLRIDHALRRAAENH
jgi:hypothetical protein